MSRLLHSHHAEPYDVATNVELVRQATLELGPNIRLAHTHVHITKEMKQLAVMYLAAHLIASLTFVLKLLMRASLHILHVSKLKAATYLLGPPLVY